ncbi:MAG: 15-cis-phytoene synthase [Solirubrobacteraceae bacterium]|nr:15-cis-phytoene synthase [Solirubrobacteraceae bacterium]
MLLHRSEDLELEQARATTKRVARTFAIACRLLPRALRDDVYRLYLVFRTLDDLVDDADPCALERIASVEAWSEGRPHMPSRETLALSDLARRHALPRGAIEDFCQGMRDDVLGPQIDSEAELDVYCHRVAGTVGVVMSAVLGATDPAAPRHASALGQAMQRTNILRDIDEDLENGRVYLARETLHAFGWGTVPPPTQRATVLRDQIERADALYQEGLAGIVMLPHGRCAISAAAAMYREILRQIERDGYGVAPGRAVVPSTRKLVVAARAQVTAVRRA